MDDITYTFVSDTSEKKRTARGAHNRKTHAGKGGRVRFPSDNLTKKELRAMSGEVQSYRMNEPVSWAEFKRYPADIQTAYLRALKNRYNAPCSAIAAMMGVSVTTITRKFDELALPAPKNRYWEREAFAKWRNGIRDEDTPEETPVIEQKPAPVVEAAAPVIICPVSGHLSFQGNARAALAAVASLVPDDAHIEILWGKCNG